MLTTRFAVRRHLTYANVAATLALVFSMSAGALAASHYLITSTSQIKPNVRRALVVGQQEQLDLILRWIEDADKLETRDNEETKAISEHLTQLCETVDRIDAKQLTYEEYIRPC